MRDEAEDKKLGGHEMGISRAGKEKGESRDCSHKPNMKANYYFFKQYNY